MRATIFSACLMAGCTGSGSLELDLSLPTTPDLRPQNMTTVTVIATSPQMGSISSTALIANGHAQASDTPVGDGIQVDVLLRDVSSRLVGVGEAPNLVDVKGDKTTQLTIPVRRPFLYPASGSMLYTYDPTLDPRDPKFQGQLAGVTAPQLAVSVGGDRLVVAGTTTLQIVDTATHKVTGNPITIAGTIHDVAPVPGKPQVAVAHTGGISIVDLDSSNVQNAAVGAIDRITVGPDANGKMFAFGLIGRTAPPELPPELATCSGMSSLVTVAVDNPSVSAPKTLPMAVSAIAAAPSSPALYATLPCDKQVAKVMGDPTAEVSTLMFAKQADLDGAAVVAVFGDRVWAAGTRPSSPVCENGTGPVQCVTGTPIGCPEPSGAHLAYVTQGARLVVQSIPLAGGMPITFELPERRETMISTDDPAQQHAQVLHSLSIVPLDLVVQPGGQNLSLVARSAYYIESLSDGIQTILPCLQGTTGDWLLLDMAQTSVAQRVRTECMLTVGPGAFFRKWSCDAPPEAETTKVGEYMPQSVGALFGAR